MMTNVTRRTVLAGAGAAVATLLSACFSDDPAQSPTSAAPTDAPVEPITITDAMLATFAADIEAAMQVFGMLGAAVAVVEADKIGSNTKSMTSLLIAKYVDQGLCSWDTPVIELWPGFVGPTPGLTASLTLAALLGMGSGIGEPERIEFFAAGGGVSAIELLQTIAHLEVVADDGAQFFCNNTLVAAAPYLVMLANGTDPADLEGRYANDLASLVFRPVGMDDAEIAADPRAFGPDCAAGYTKDLAGTLSRTPFVSIGGYGPAGSVLASSTDMARYLITQARGGVAPDGTVVASEAAVTRTHTAGVVVPANATNALPDLLLGDWRR